MTDTIEDLLGTYGHDLDDAIAERCPADGDVRRTAPHRHRTAYAFAAACLLLVGFASVALLAADEDSPAADEPVSTTVEQTTSSVASDELPTGTLLPLMDAPPAHPLSGEVVVDGDTLVFETAPTGPTVVRFQRSGEPSSGATFSETYEDGPMWAMSMATLGSPTVEYWGVVGPNGATIEATMADGRVFRAPTHEVPGMRGPRVFVVEITIGGTAEIIEHEEGARSVLRRGANDVESLVVLDDAGHVVLRIE